MDSVHCVVIGAGFAGAATAYHLTRRGLTDILLLEQETIPGFHSSGRNAAMIRQCVPDPVLGRLTRDGAAFLRSLPSDWPIPVEFKQNGSLLLGSGKGWEKLKQDAESGRNLGIDVTSWTPEQAKSHVPVLKEAEFDGAIWCATDGTIDIHALLSGYLKAAAAKGMRIRYGSAVEAIHARGADELEVVSQWREHKDQGVSQRQRRLGDYRRQDGGSGRIAASPLPAPSLRFSAVAMGGSELALRLGRNPRHLLSARRRGFAAVRL